MRVPRAVRRPTSFVSSCGNRSEQALAELRAIFFGKAAL